MKVAINACFGGFGLSPQAMKRLAELKGRECYFFTQDIKAGLDSPYIPATIESLGDAMFFSAFSIPNPNEVLVGLSDWNGGTLEDRKAANKQYEAVSISPREYERNDPDLITVIEELGEAANGKCADLKIVDIPDDVKFDIEEYDGSEHVAEQHRTWYAEENQ